MISIRQFNKLSQACVLVVLGSSVVSNLFASNTAIDIFKLQKTEVKTYKAKKLTGLYMTLLNGVLVKFPTTALRMSMAAERGQIVVNDIDKLDILGVSGKGEPIYFQKAEQEQNYVKKELKFVLEPVEKFIEDIKEQREIVKNLLGESLGQDRAKKSFISTALDVEGSFLVYFSKTIKTVSELNTVASEFLMFFADVKESLCAKAKEAMDELVKKLRAKDSSNKK
jgi:hypothetical protein